jgi:hypothetical protein
VLHEKIGFVEFGRHLGVLAADLDGELLIGRSREFAMVVENVKDTVGALES